MSSKSDKAALAKGAKTIRRAEVEAKAGTSIELRSGEQSESTTERSWRDVQRVHPICDEFPLMEPDQLRELADDIAAIGLQDSILTCRTSAKSPLYVIDGRDRLNAWELF